MTAVLSNVRSWSTNWPRYVKPAGIWPTPPVPAAIRLPTFLRIVSESCRPAPFGPSREKRNGGVTASTSTASVGERPRAGLPGSPSPRTKKLSEPCASMARSPSLQLDLLAPKEDTDVVSHRADDAHGVCRTWLEATRVTGVYIEGPGLPRLLEFVRRGRHPGDFVLLLRDRDLDEAFPLPPFPVEPPTGPDGAVDDLES